MSHSRALLFALAAWLAPRPGIALAEAEALDASVVITSPDNQTQGMVLGLTTRMVEQGRNAPSSYATPRATSPSRLPTRPSRHRATSAPRTC